VGWPARDPFGDPTRPPLDPVEAVHRLAELGAYGVTFHDGPRHFDYKPLRTENIDGVWESAAANMRTYLILKQRAAAFRADPEVQAALEAAKVAELRQPTLAPGETYEDLLADRSAFEDYDVDTTGAQGYGSSGSTSSPSSTCSAPADHRLSPPVYRILDDSAACSQGCQNQPRSPGISHRD
jgi:hypothetical protein